MLGSLDVEGFEEGECDFDGLDEGARDLLGRAEGYLDGTCDGAWVGSVAPGV